MSIFEKVKEIICEVLGVDEEKVTEAALLKDDLGADSLDAVEIIMDIEDNFNVEIEDGSLQTIKTVGDIVKAIEALKN